VGDLATLETLADELVEAGTAFAPASLHGAVCGFAVFAASEFPYYTLANLLDPSLSGDDPALVRFVDAVREGLTDEDLGFALLLPDDEVPLEDRLAALALWCDGFLSAFGAGLGAIAELGDDASGFGLSDELQEIVDDLAAIAEVEPESALDADEDADDDDPEAQFMELEEFVRVAVLLIMSELARGDTDQND
jgi:uncharacterized protein YgfB (UPF0149 family)